MALHRTALTTLAVLCTGCDDVDDMLAAGNIEGACQRAQRLPDEQPIFSAWVAQHATVTAQAVPAADIERTLGGPVRGYGTELTLYDVRGAAPSGELGFKPLERNQPITELIARLPQLRRLTRPPTPAIVQPEDLAVPARSSPRSSDFIGDIFDAFGMVGMGIGMAIGVAVAVPIGIIAGVANGIGSILGAIFGGGGGPTLEEYVAPIYDVEPTDPPRIDALVREQERTDAVNVLAAEYARHLSLVDAERARRIALAKDPLLLDADPARCEHGVCRALVEKLPLNVESTARFGRDPGACEVQLLVRVSPIVSAAGDDASPTIEVAASPARLVEDDTARLEDVAVSLDAAGPGWAFDYPARLTKRDLIASSAPRDGPPATVNDLACVVHVERRGYDSDRTAPDLAARFTAGGAHSRSHTAWLGENVADAAFVVHGLALQPGERVRLSLGSRAGGSLGGVLVEYDGRLPIVLKNPAFRATCEPAVLVMNRALAAENEALAAVDAYAGLTRRPEPPSANALAAARTKARTEVARLAALFGWDNTITRGLVEEERSAVVPAPSPEP